MNMGLIDIYQSINKGYWETFFFVVVCLFVRDIGLQDFCFHCDLVQRLKCVFGLLWLLLPIKFTLGSAAHSG